MSSSLEGIDLACRRGHRMLFQGFSFEARAQELVWIRGRNGSGKTSLLRLATGLSTPERGELRWHGEPVRRSSRYRDRLVFIGHANALKEDLSVSEALAFLLQLHRRPHAPTDLHAALERFGLATRRDAMVRTLSQGQRRRVALARLIAEIESSVWLLDEPFDGLDTEGVESLNAVLAEHLERGGCVLLTSHQPVGTARFRPVEIDLNRYS